MKKTVIFLFGLFALSRCYAALDLASTQGMKAPIPIAILAFATDDQTAMQQNMKIEAIIRQDLQHSGHFQIANNASFNQSPSDESDIDVDYWRQFRLNAMVVGKVQDLGEGQYRVTFSLVNLVKPQPVTNVQAVPAAANVASQPVKLPSNQIDDLSAATDANDPSTSPSTPATVTPATVLNTVASSTQQLDNNPVLMTQSVTFSKQSFRHAAHQISNSIYQKLTGKPGIFTTKIAYVRTQAQGEGANQSIEYALELADYDGDDAKTLFSSANPIMSPSWSPDGTQLAFVSFDNEGYPAIYTMPANGGEHKLLSAVTGLNAAPTWSPNAQQIALVLSKTGNSKIYLLTMASKQLTALTEGWSADTEPTWSPDGVNVLFTSNRDGSPQIYQINLNSKTVTQLTHAGSYNAMPVMTIDGKALLMIHGEGAAYNVLMQRFDGSQAPKLLTHTGLVSSFTAAPDNNLVMYSTFSRGHEILLVTSIDGTVNFALPANQMADLKEPAWGPINK